MLYFQYNFHLLLAEIQLLLKDKLDIRYRDKSLSKNCLASSEHEDSALVFAVKCSRYLLPVCVSPVSTTWEMPLLVCAQGALLPAATWALDSCPLSDNAPGGCSTSGGKGLAVFPGQLKGWAATPGTLSRYWCQCMTDPDHGMLWLAKRTAQGAVQECKANPAAV